MKKINILFIILNSIYLTSVITLFYNGRVINDIDIFAIIFNSIFFGINLKDLWR